MGADAPTRNAAGETPEREAGELVEAAGDS
jgi:hypothetical protein